jgi:hypothetical protein
MKQLLTRECASQPLRSLGDLSTRRHSFGARSSLARAHITIADQSAPIWLGQAYARAAATAASFQVTPMPPTSPICLQPSFQQTVTSTPITPTADILLQPVCPAPTTGPPPSLEGQSPHPTPAFLLSRRPRHAPPPQLPRPDLLVLQSHGWQDVLSRLDRPLRHRHPPSYKHWQRSHMLLPMPSKSASPSQRQQRGPAPASAVSITDSFYSTVLLNSSIIDSDKNNLGTLADISQPPFIPTVYIASKTGNTSSTPPPSPQL